MNIKLDFGAASPAPPGWTKVSELGISSIGDGLVLSLSADNIDGSFSPDPDLITNDNFFSFPGEPWELLFTGLPQGEYDITFYAPSNPLVNIGAAEPTSAIVDENGTLLFLSTSMEGFRGLAGIELASHTVPEPGGAWLLPFVLLLAWLRKQRRGLGHTGHPATGYPEGSGNFRTTNPKEQTR